MSNITRFTLKTYNKIDNKLVSIPNYEEFIDEFRTEFSQCAYSALNVFGDSEDSITWHSHEEELKIFSLRYFNTVFVLSGMGEENEDMWIKYFYNGKMQECRAIITYPEFDESRLQ